MHCNGCGTELPDDSQFCHKCGQALTSTTTAGANPTAADAAAVPAAWEAQPKPYRWGRFQGWLMVVLGVLIAGIGACVLFAPGNRTVQAFVNGFFSNQPQMLNQLQTSKEPEDYAHLVGLFTAYMMLTFGTGVGILKNVRLGWSWSSC